MRPTRDGWLRCDRKEPCPICGVGDWCTVSPDLALACCMRESKGAIKELKNGGFLHVLKERERILPPRRAKAPRPIPEALPVPVPLSEDEAARHAAALGVDPSSLHAMDARLWRGDLAFPMRAPRGAIIGYRLRLQDGRKLCIKGSQNGPFIPQLEFNRKELLLVVEGPTDVCALLTLNIQAIGRPSNTGGHDMLCEACRGFSRVGILADRDVSARARELTEDAARKLAMALAERGGIVKIFRPPACKDSREWLKMGATRKTILAVWNNANSTRPEKPLQNYLDVLSLPSCRQG